MLTKTEVYIFDSDTEILVSSANSEIIRPSVFWQKVLHLHFYYLLLSLFFSCIGCFHFLHVLLANFGMINHSPRTIFPNDASRRKLSIFGFHPRLIDVCLGTSSDKKHAFLYKTQLICFLEKFHWSIASKILSEKCTTRQPMPREIVNGPIRAYKVTFKHTCLNPRLKLFHLQQTQR